MILIFIMFLYLSFWPHLKVWTIPCLFSIKFSNTITKSFLVSVYRLRYLTRLLFFFLVHSMSVVTSGTVYHVCMVCTVFMQVVLRPGGTSRLLVEKNSSIVNHSHDEILESFPWPQTASQMGQILTKYGPFLQTDPERKKACRRRAWFLASLLRDTQVPSP